MYGTLRRLASQGLLETEKVPAPRTGAQRKDFRLSGPGQDFLQRIETVSAHRPV